MDEQLSHSSCVKSAYASPWKCKPEQCFLSPNDCTYLDWTGNAVNQSAIPLKDQLGDLQVEQFLFQSRQGVAEKIIKKVDARLQRRQSKHVGLIQHLKKAQEYLDRSKPKLWKLREQSRRCMRVSVLWKAGWISSSSESPMTLVRLSTASTAGGASKQDTHFVQAAGGGQPWDELKS